MRVAVELVVRSLRDLKDTAGEEGCLENCRRSLDLVGAVAEICCGDEHESGRCCHSDAGDSLDDVVFHDNYPFSVTGFDWQSVTAYGAGQVMSSPADYLNVTLLM